MPAPQPAEHGPSPHPPSLRTRNRHHPKRRRPVTGAGDRAATQRWYEASPSISSAEGPPSTAHQAARRRLLLSRAPTLVNKGREARRHRRSVPKDDSHMIVILRCRVLGAWRRRGPQPSASGATALKSSRAAAPRAGVAAAALEQRRLDELLQRREVAAALRSHRTDHRQHLGEEREQGDHEKERKRSRERISAKEDECSPGTWTRRRPSST